MWSSTLSALHKILLRKLDKDEMGRHVARMAKMINAYKFFLKKRKGPLGRPGSREDDNITMDNRDVGFGDVDFINHAQNRS